MKTVIAFIACLLAACMDPETFTIGNVSTHTSYISADSSGYFDLDGKNWDMGTMGHPGGKQIVPGWTAPARISGVIDSSGGGWYYLRILRAGQIREDGFYQEMGLDWLAETAFASGRIRGAATENTLQLDGGWGFSRIYEDTKPTMGTP